jgi:hypothetical protein
MLRLKSIAVAGLLSLSSANAMAGGVVGTVVDIVTRASDGLIYVDISGTPTGQPACATHSYFIIMNETSAAGQKQYALLLVAKASGLSVSIGGNNTCTRWPDGEDINIITLTG